MSIGWITILGAGFLATIAALVVQLAAGDMGLPRVDAVRIAGTLVTSRERAASVVGLVLLLLDGWLCSFLYAWAWSNGVGAFTFGWAFVFGVAHGLLAHVVLVLLAQVHPRRELVPTASLTLVTLVTAHVTFALCLVVAWRASS